MNGGWAGSGSWMPISLPGSLRTMWREILGMPERPDLKPFDSSVGALSAGDVAILVRVGPIALRHEPDRGSSG
jgi:hypothetical protein